MGILSLGQVNHSDQNRFDGVDSAVFTQLVEYYKYNI